MRSTRVFVICLSVVSAACGSESVSPLPTPPPPVAKEAFAQAYADALCARSERCFNLAPHLVDQCREDTLALYADDVVKGVAAGRLIYDAAAAGECVARVEATPCLAARLDDATQAACFKALRGALAPGEACYAPFECAAGICGGDPSTTCPATCPEVLHEGDACSLIMGPSCDEQAGLRCSVGVCVRPGPLGSPCADRNACQSGLVCNGTQCAELREVKQGCAGDSSCVVGLYCVAEGDEGGLCEPRLPEGAKCGSTAEDNNAALLGSQCADGLVCKGAGLTSAGLPVGGVCSKPSPLGGACLVEPGGMQVQLSGCLRGLECPSGQCELPPASGPCAPHYVCNTVTTYCDVGTTTCMPLKADGDACAIDFECEGGACDGGLCAQKFVYCHEG